MRPDRPRSTRQPSALAGNFSFHRSLRTGLTSSATILRPIKRSSVTRSASLRRQTGWQIVNSDFLFGLTHIIAFDCLSYRVAGTDRQCQFLRISGDSHYDVADENCEEIEFADGYCLFQQPLTRALVLKADFIVLKLPGPFPYYDSTPPGGGS